MKAEARSLTFLANEGSVKIPFFQRAYVWNEVNWEDLLTDLLESGKSHFLGSLILKQVEVQSGSIKQVLVIDGQQRLTTLSILIRTLYDSFDLETQEACKQELDTCLFYKKKASSKELFVKIEHSKVDRKHFQSVIKKEVAPESLDISKTDSNILRCYKFFTDRLMSVDIGKRIELFDDLMDDEKKILVVIDLTDADDEQTIFDTINSAGVRLSSADIVKNALFQKALDVCDNQEDVEVLYLENWEAIFANDEQTIAFWDTQRSTGRLMRDNIEILLHSIAVIEGFFDPEKQSLSDLSNVYKAYISGMDWRLLTTFIKTISEYARLYREKILVFGNSDLFSFSDYRKRLFHILGVLDVSTFHPYLLFLFRKYSDNEAQLQSALQKLEAYVVRRAVCNLTTKNYNNLCKTFIANPARIVEALAETKDDDVKKGLQQIYNKTAALLLFWVELYRRKNDNRYDRDELKYTYTLEHIMPQKWEEYWSDIPVTDDDSNFIEDAEIAKQYRYKLIYSIGNMTLLKSSLNSAVRNYEFKRKVEGEGRKRGIEHYAELGITKFDIVSPFKAGDIVWDETKIRARTALITEDILKIWSIR